MSDEMVRFQLRIPESLRRHLEASARLQHRSVNQEINARLAASFGDVSDLPPLPPLPPVPEKRTVHSRLSALEDAVAKLEAVNPSR